MVFDLNGTKILSGGADNDIKIWNAQDKDYNLLTTINLIQPLDFWLVKFMYLLINLNYYIYI